MCVSTVRSLEGLLSRNMNDEGRLGYAVDSGVGGDVR